MQPTQHHLSSRSLLLVGILLLFTPVVFILIFPGAYDPARIYLRLSASLGGAMIGALIPGIFHIDTSSARAAGGLGIFLLTFLIDPPGAVSGKFESQTPHKSEQPSKIDIKIDENFVKHTQPQPLPDDKNAGMAPCIAAKVRQFEQPKTKSAEGGARAPGPEFSNETKTSQEDVCISVGPNQKIIDADPPTELSCFGGRCSVSAVRFSNDQRTACITTKAWSESKYFGGGGTGKYRLTVNYKSKVNDDDLQQFRQDCLLGR